MLTSRLVLLKLFARDVIDKQVMVVHDFDIDMSVCLTDVQWCRDFVI